MHFIYTCLTHTWLTGILFIYLSGKQPLDNKHISTPKMGEILLEEFMEPNGISAYMLAKEIHVPVSRIQDILHDRRKVTVDTSLRLARFFGVSDKYFLDIQNDIDLREAKMALQTEILSINPYKETQAI